LITLDSFVTKPEEEEKVKGEDGKGKEGKQKKCLFILVKYVIQILALNHLDVGKVPRVLRPRSE
jgi:hypothetical protein